MDALVLRGVRLGSGGPVTDVAVVGGSVVEIASPVIAPPGADEVDGRGSVLLPGLVDGHVHSVQWATRRRRIDVSHASSPHDVAALIRAATPRDAATGPDRRRSVEVVVGHGFRDALWTVPPHRQVLDAEFGAQAVAVVSHDLHSLWLNTAGLAVVGRPEHQTGVLREDKCFAATAMLTARQPPEVVDRWVLEATRAAAERGVTEITDFEFADNYTDWLRRAAVEAPAVRVRCAVWRPWLDAAIARGLRTGDPMGDAAGRLLAGPFKVLADGSLNTRTAYCFDAYPDAGDDDHGMLLVDPAELVEQMSRAWAGGLEPAVHTIGDRAASIVLDAFEAVGCPGRIEHAQLVRPVDLPRFARAGVVASVQPQHVTADRDVADRQWPGRTAWSFPYGALHAAGARLEFGSDAPVSPLDPWAAIADAIERTDDDRPAWHREHCLPLDAALRAATGGRGVIGVGDRADLVLVGEDPGEVSTADLRNMPVRATLVAGRFTHRDGTL